jgi:hypothetical protein
VRLDPCQARHIEPLGVRLDLASQDLNFKGGGGLPSHPSPFPLGIRGGAGRGLEGWVKLYPGSALTQVGTCRQSLFAVSLARPAQRHAERL